MPIDNVPSKAKLPIRCSFENTITPFFLYKYSDGPTYDYLTTEPVYNGKYAFRIDKDVCTIRYRHQLPIANYGMEVPIKVSIMMYDDPSKTNAFCMTILGGLSGTSTDRAGIGVNGKISPDKYVIVHYGDVFDVTEIKRTKGWHKLVFDFQKWPGNNNRGCMMFLDGQALGTASGLPSFTTVDIGDPEFGSDSRGMCFDDFSIE
jgi:hypothetical protein